MQTPGTRTHRPHPHPCASAWIKTEAIRSCSQEQTGAEISQSPTHAPLKRTRADPSALAHSDPRLRGAVSARFAVQTQGQRKASLPGWRSGLLCSQPGSCLGLRVTRGSSCQCLELQHMGHGTAWHSTDVLPDRWRNPEYPGRWQHPAWGCSGERPRPSSPPTNPSPTSSHPILADGDFPFSVEGFFFCKAQVYEKHVGPQQAAWRERREMCWKQGVGSAVAGDGQVGAQRGAPNPVQFPRNSALTALGGWEMQLPTGQIPLGWSVRRAGQGSLLLAGSSWYQWQLTLCIAVSTVALCSCLGRWSPAGWSPPCGCPCGCPCGWQAGEAPAVCQPSGASPQHSCLSSFPHLGCFAIYSPGNVSASQRAAKHFLPLVINLRAGLPRGGRK